MGGSPQSPWDLLSAQFLFSIGLLILFRMFSWFWRATFVSLASFSFYFGSFYVRFFFLLFLDLIFCFLIFCIFYRCGTRPIMIGYNQRPNTKPWWAVNREPICPASSEAYKNSPAHRVRPRIPSTWANPRKVFSFHFFFPFLYLYFFFGLFFVFYFPFFVFQPWDIFNEYFSKNNFFKYEPF